MDLNDIMEIDHVVTVKDGEVVGSAPGVWAPEVYHEDVHPDGVRGYANPAGWEFLNGYSGQEGYSGPVMHSSEFIGGGLERDILDEDGVYVAVVVECLTDDDYPDGAPEGHEFEPAGWAVLRLK
jgi:hypothetical protein